MHRLAIIEALASLKHPNGECGPLDKPEKTPERIDAIKKGIDQIGHRTGWLPTKLGVKMFVQGWPYCFLAKGHWITKNGAYYDHKKTAYITVMPEELGGLAAMASLALHEGGGHPYHIRVLGVDEAALRDAGKDPHGEKPEFWERIDAPVEL